PRSGLVVTGTSNPDERRWSMRADGLPVAQLFDLRRLGQPMLDSGTITGSLELRALHDAFRFEAKLASRAARLPSLDEDSAKPSVLGRPTEIKVDVAGSWKPAEGALDVPRWSAQIEGATASGSLALRDIKTDAAVDLALEIERVDFAKLLHTWGLEAPESLGVKSGGPTVELGSATLSATARGRTSQPASFVVTQKLDFTPPEPIPSPVLKLRGDFVHQAVSESGAVRTIVVSPSSPDFIPLDAVPPLFLRALLIAEDAGFYGHPGIDLREVPSALITDWNRGGAARGASTITQQLAKNLFLSREKQLGRKVQELSVTLLLEAALSKRRILEIYLNVIEWGPGLYGLRPAARVYFDREPADLTPAQMAFLISIIPGPLKYQSSFAHGTPGPGLRKLVDNLLAKLRSVDALTEEEYQSALAEGIVVSGRGAPASQPTGGTPEPSDDDEQELR
ncbi:MAG TPA: biosynthetic peptidoglycan transglycosylase, partial [Candidatus Polarisedimenticolia bacterium]|nr:biosynthetic peptidoglycan transglycosylase [Candidatus Polarisedimenticolia bacterium]